MELEINSNKYLFKELIYYDGFKLGYDLSNKSLIVWHDETDDYDEFILLDCHDIFDGMMLYLLNENKLKALFLTAKLSLIKFYEDKMEVIENISFKNITLPTDSSYLGFSFLDNFKEPKQSNLSFNSIKNISIQIKKMFTDEILDINDLELINFVEKLGGRVHYLGIDLWNKTEEGSVLVHGLRDFDIFLPSFGGIEANRFTIAHEIGHYIIHSNIGERQLKAAKYGDEGYEIEANFFAMSLLVPTEVLEDKDKNSLDISNKYFVSEHNVRVHREFLSAIENR